jgi:energy-coupling factor transport system ATP-binding protein
MEEELLADRVVVMTGGQITATGTPREIFADETVLKHAGLTAPPHIELYHRLKNKGYDLGECPLTIDELVDKLCR